MLSGHMGQSQGPNKEEHKANDHMNCDSQTLPQEDKAH